MAYIKVNSAQMLSLVGCLDPHRNPRNVEWQPFGWRNMRVSGILRDDSSIPVDRPRERVETLGFDVVVPKDASVWDIQVAIQQQTQAFA
jgi:hypothetical protein